MAYCKRCGTKLKEGAVFCKNCGLKIGDPVPQIQSGPGGRTSEEYQKMVQDGVGAAVDKTKEVSGIAVREGRKGIERLVEKCRSDKRYGVAAVGIAAAVFIVIIAVVMMGEMGKKIRLEDCVIVETSGYDTRGTAYARLDEEAFIQAAVKAKGGKTKLGPTSPEWYAQLDKLDIYALENLVSLEVANPEGLSNGDEVTVNIVYDKERAKEYDVKFSGSSYVYTVSGLPALQELDPFAGLDVRFEGVAPDISLVYEYKGTDGLLSTYNFMADTSYGFSEGDKVTVSVDMPEETAAANGYHLTGLSKDYTCEKVDAYLGSADQLSDSVLDRMKKDAADCIESYFSGNYDYISCEELEYEGCYVLVAKDASRRYTSTVYLVHSTMVSSKEESDGEPLFHTQAIFFPVAFSGIVCKADGTVEYEMNANIAGGTDLNFNGWSTVAGYKNRAKMYNELAGSNKVDYDIEMVGSLDMPEEDAGTEGENTDYILPTSNSAYLTVEDLEGLDKEECRLARNEIYARYGRIFEDEGLQAYFGEKDWYEGTVSAEDITDDMLNEYELANRDLIVDYEEEMGYR